MCHALFGPTQNVKAIAGIQKLIDRGRPLSILEGVISTEEEEFIQVGWSLVTVVAHQAYFGAGKITF
jgi:hypothetical protein